MQYDTSHASSSKIESYTFNGNTGTFNRDTSSGASEEKLSLVQPFQIFLIRRQYILEDTTISGKSMQKGAGLYKSTIFEEGSDEILSLYSQGEIFSSVSQKKEFTQSQLEALVKSSPDLKLNKKILIYGFMNDKIYQITCSEGNFRAIGNFIQKHTTTLLTPFCSMKPTEKTNFKRTYFALKIELFQTGKLQPSNETVSKALQSIYELIENYNSKFVGNNERAILVLQEFESRIKNGYLSLPVGQEGRESAPVPLSEAKEDPTTKILKEYFDPAEPDPIVSFEDMDKLYIPTEEEFSL